MDPGLKDPFQAQTVKLASGPWQQVASLDTARSGLSAVVYDGQIYAAGGTGLISPRNEFEVYDPDADIWRPLAALPVGLEGFGMTVWQDRIWIAGGYSSDSKDKPIDLVWSYDPSRNIWQSETPLAGPKASFSLLTVDDNLYALAGEQGLEGLMIYDQAALEWSARPAPEATNRRGGAALVKGYEIWLIGGVKDGESSSRVDIFNTQTSQWRVGPSLPEPRAGHSLGLIDGKIHVFGGRRADLRATRDDYLVLDDGEWTSVGTLPSPRTDGASVIMRGRAWLVGGGAGGGFFAPFTAIDTVDVFDPVQ